MEELKGKTIEAAQIGVKTIVVKFNDGTYLDIEIVKDEKESEKWQYQLSTKLNKI